MLANKALVKLHRLIPHAVESTDYGNSLINFTRTIERIWHKWKARHHDPKQPITLLSPKSTSLSGTWNVRTMFQPGGATIVANEVERCKLSIPGLSETPGTSSGEMKFADGTTIIYSGHQKDRAPQTKGVAFMLISVSWRAMISWEPLNSRIIIARFRTRHQKITALTINQI